jgi:hypothetical protein
MARSMAPLASKKQLLMSFPFIVVIVVDFKRDVGNNKIVMKCIFMVFIFFLIQSFVYGRDC